MIRIGELEQFIHKEVFKGLSIKVVVGSSYNNFKGISQLGHDINIIESEKSFL